MKTYWGSGGIAPRTLNLGARQSGKLHALGALPSEKNRRNPLDRRLGVHQIQSERGGEEKSFQPLPGLQLQSSSP
jgi:hypothetical protein